jgi:hypothetical protein
MSYINRPPLELDKPQLEMYQQSYLNFSPTKVRKNSMVKGNHMRNYTTGLPIFKESSSSYINTQSNQPNQTHSYIKLSCSRPQKTETEVEEFGKELEIRPRKESYIERFSPKKKRSILEV